MAGNDGALPTLVVDVGSASVKCGFGGEDAPRKVFPTVLGWPRHPGLGGVMLGGKKDNFVGEEAASRAGVLRVVHPVQRGEIVDWNEMDKLLYHMFYSELVVAPDEHPLLFMESPGVEKSAREKLAQLLFEGFNCPALVCGSQACMSLFSSGRSTGVVYSSGAGVSYAVPIWEGYSLPHQISRHEIAGSDLTSYLVKLLRSRGLPFSTPGDRLVAEDIKEKLCYVALDYQKELKNAEGSRSFERFYKMPDGADVRLVNDRFTCPEALFQPALMGSDGVGIQAALHDCVQKCDPLIRKELYGNVVLSGGNTMFPKIGQRLTKELSLLAGDVQVNVVDFPERHFSSWLGGSLLASLPTFPAMWLAKKEYDEVGVAALHKKAF